VPQMQRLPAVGLHSASGVREGSRVFSFRGQSGWRAWLSPTADGRNGAGKGSHGKCPLCFCAGMGIVQSW
jgi:hypothetical protein